MHSIHCNIGNGNSSSNQTKCMHCGLSKFKTTDIFKINKLCFDFTKHVIKMQFISLRKTCIQHHTPYCHTSRYYAIKEQQQEDMKQKEKIMRAINTTSKLLTLHSTVLATVNSAESWILLGKGSSSPYICTKLISAFN